MSELSDLVQEVSGQDSNSVVYSHIFLNVIADPSLYSLSKLPDRTAELQLGKDVIPRAGATMFVDNDFYEQQDPLFRANYPELNTQGPALLVEKVKCVTLRLPLKLPIKIGAVYERYLIKSASVEV